ncbi:MAG TPA: HAD-IC family P-type ATPase [Gemmatimonadaceae bacterium]
MNGISRGTPAASPLTVEPWHILAVADVERALATGQDGLSARAAVERLRQLGPNEVESEPQEPWWRLVLRQLRDPLVYILLAAAAVSLTLRDYADAGVILAVVLLNAVIGFVQEYRAREAVRSLARLSAPHALVIRDGRPQEIASRDLVPGDAVELVAGSRVPADMRLVQVRGIAVDESLLTGESLPVQKGTEPMPNADVIVADQTNMLFAGTTVVHGRGRGLVVRTGSASELGRIAHVMREVGTTATPLQTTLARFGRLVGIAILGLAAAVLALGLFRALPPAEIFLTAVALAVAAIPEGLPVVLTVTLAVAVRRMARRRAIVRSLPAVETLGSTTVIGSDKTGTLTKNEMTVRAIWAGGQHHAVSGSGYAVDGRIEQEGRVLRADDSPSLAAALRVAVLATEVDPAHFEAGQLVGDPTDIALLVAAMKGGIVPSELRRQHPELDSLPFESERRLMLSLRESPAGPVEHLKGAPEVVLARCHRELGPEGERSLQRERALAVAAEYAANGLRVLALAYRHSSGRHLTSASLGDDYVLTGLIGMEDPLRPEAVAAAHDAHSAGIRVLMLTGDHAETARAVGKRLGLGDRVLSGHEIERLSDAELSQALRDVNCFARVTPEHKLRIVQQLKRADEVVAVTGDGVNDAPALRAAHLGIAMGMSGSDVAREASDIVLADDNFATITSAIEEGRVVFANIRKATFFLLSTAAGEILAIMVTVLAGWPLPFSAAQILWINLVTDSVEDIALAFEPGEPDLLRRPPRPRREGVLTGRLVLRLGGVGLVLASVTLGMFWYTLNATGDLTIARTVAVTQMVVMQFYHTFNCRSLDRSVLRIPLFSNRFLFISMVAVAAVHLSALYVPPLRRVLHLAPLDAAQWGLILLVGLSVVVGGEIDKLINRSLRRRLG